nr:MAG TPA: hypothetical protein [Caudoviricetes sp.]
MEYKIERLGVAGTLACRFEHKGRRIDGGGANRLHRSVHREDGRRSGKGERA